MGLQDLSHLVHVTLMIIYMFSDSLYSCLAHIINLATQAVLSTYSKTPHYNHNSMSPLEPTIDVLDAQLMHNIVGLIQCIAVKVF